MKLIKKQYYCGRKDERDLWVKELSRLVRFHEHYKTKTTEESKEVNSLKQLGTDQVNLQKIVATGQKELPISKRQNKKSRDMQ